VPRNKSGRNRITAVIITFRGFVKIFPNLGDFFNSIPVFVLPAKVKEYFKTVANSSKCKKMERDEKLKVLTNNSK
jgi:hypothetical protein